MVAQETEFRISSTPAANRSVGRAWLALCFALGVHVADEAATGFLEVYNPMVVAIRADLPWLPLPVFRFEVWLAGLVCAVAALVALSVFVFRGARWTRLAAYAFAAIMTANALLHTVGTIRYSRPMPGFYSSTFLLAASIYLLQRLRTSGK